jgi:hypothetical protein
MLENKNRGSGDKENMGRSLKGFSSHQYRGAAHQEIRVKQKLEKNHHISDFWIKLDLNAGLFFIPNFAFFF